jgi:peptide/nickel transport system permease protein
MTGGGRSRLGLALLRIAASAVITLGVISVLTFGVSNYKSPEGVARSALGIFATEEQLQSYIEEHGLDAPIYERYGNWLADAVRGDFGTSEITNRSVLEEIGPRFVRSLTLAAAALVIALPLSIALGVFMARRALHWSDTSLLVTTVVVAAMPEFVLGVGLLMLFGVTLGWLPVDSTGISFGGFGSEVRAYVLPTLTLVVAVVPYLARLTRVALRETLSAPFVQAAVLRGLSRRTVVWNHALRGSAVPLVNAVAIAFVNLLSGVVVIENVFAFPGIGQALVEAVSNGDAVTTQAIVLILGATIIAVNVLADVAVTYFNPRLRVRRT